MSCSSRCHCPLLICYGGQPGPSGLCVCEKNSPITARWGFRGNGGSCLHGCDEERGVCTLHTEKLHVAGSWRIDGGRWDGAEKADAAGQRAWGLPGTQADPNTLQDPQLVALPPTCLPSCIHAPHPSKQMLLRIASFWTCP